MDEVFVVLFKTAV